MRSMLKLLAVINGKAEMITDDRLEYVIAELKDFQNEYADRDNDAGNYSNELKFDEEIAIREELLRLRKRVSDQDEAVKEFNMGVKAFDVGLTLDDEPSGLKHDEWRIGWCWEAHSTITADNLRLRGRNQQLEDWNKRLMEDGERMAENLIWCSGSNDFSPEGQAHVGWDKCVRPALDQHTALLAEIKESENG